MISIIISSYQPNFFNALEKNISETCGVEHEIIKIDNHNLMSISEAYNKGASKAQFPHLLFLHEDILFHTEGWGTKFIEYLTQKSAGIIGVAGGGYVPAAPCGWNVHNEQYKHLHLIQNNKKGDAPKLINTFVESEKSIECYAIDGVFMGMTKEKFNKYKFNEEIKGFHGYDLDLSLRVAKKYRNYVIGNILIEHFSHGSADQAWFENNIQIRKKLGNNYHPYKNADIETKIFINFLELFFKYYGITLKNILQSLFFLPLGKVNGQHYLTITKQYYYHLRYKKLYKRLPQQ